MDKLLEKELKEKIIKSLNCINDLKSLKSILTIINTIKKRLGRSLPNLFYFVVNRQAFLIRIQILL